MRVPAVGVANYPIFRRALPLLCLMAAATVAGADDSLRERDLSVRDLESVRVKLAPTQKLRKASYAQRPSEAASQISTVTGRTPNGSRNTSQVSHEVEGRMRQSHSAVKQAIPHERAPKSHKEHQPVARANFEYGATPCDGCSSHSCDGICDVVVKPVCGLEPECGCDACAEACGPTCGCDACVPAHGPACGCDACAEARGPTCGPTCGCDHPGGANRLRRPGLGRFNDPRLQSFSIRAESLLWWVDGFSIPPLLTTSSAGTSIDDAGVLGLPTTSVLVGNESLTGDDVRSGGRVTLDLWFDCQQTHGIEAIYTGLGKERLTLSADSQQFPILARPFFNIEPGVAAQDAELIAFPGVLEGNALVEAESTLQSVEVLYRHAVCRDCCFRLDCLVGWRYNRLDEGLQFSDFKRVLADDLGLPIGSTLEETDRFETRNLFNGPELGILVERRNCRWTLECLMKLALGNNNSEVGIDGQSQFNVPGGQPPVTVTPAGLLTQQTNIGIHESDDFTVVSELGFTAGYQLNCHWRATLGYTFMYWSQVARPGDQIDTELNLTQLDTTGLVGAPRPRPTGVLTDLWAQGLRFGLAARF